MAKKMCRRCGGRTEHSTATYADIGASRTIGTLNDFNPLNRLLNGQAYRCDSCGHPRTDNDPCYHTPACA